MKKSLLAVAAIGAFASAAQAQSSVTVYGIMDVGFQGVTTRGPLSSTVTSETKQNITRFSGEGSETTSRLGFRGTEDLGGGTSAFFTAEFALSPTDVTLSGQGGNGLANRQTFVGLKKNGIGQAAVGMQYSPVHLAVGRTDPGQQNNMLGNVIYATNASQGNGQTTTAYTIRYANALTLQTERMAGFQLYALYNNYNASSNNTPASIGLSSAAAATGYGESNNTAAAVGLNYVWNKLNIDAAINSSKNTSYAGGAQVSAAMPASAVANTVNAPANALGTSLGMTQSYAGATYDFGILKAYAQYINAKYVSNINSNSYIQRTAQQIGVRSFITPTIEAWGSVGNGRYGSGALNALPSATAGNATANFTGYQVGANYLLSKRTNLYAIYGSTQVSSTSLNASEGASSYGVGVRHTF